MRSLLLFVLCICPLYPGDFSRSFGRGDVVKFTVPRLPPVYTGAKRAAVQIDESPAGFPGDLLRAAIEQRLATDFTIAPSSPELTFRIRIFTETPKVEVTARNETIKVQTGTKQATDQNGNPLANAAGQPVIEPVFENKEIPVEVWQGSGRLSLQVEVFGPEGRAIDGFSPSQTYNNRVIVSANGVARVDRNQLPSEAQINEALMKAVADPFLPRYCRQREVVEVRLAVGEELRPGNELAKAGQWPKAVEHWQAADPRKFAGDRQHNIGAAYEATFYELYWQGEPQARLEVALAQAKKHHDEAIARDPKEKNHRAAQERLTAATSVLRRLLAAPAPVSVSAASPPAAPPPPLAQDFRRLIRMRLRNLAVTPETERPSLEATGQQAFQLTEDETKKHIDDELVIWSKIRANLLTYKSTFDSFNTDQKISKDERQVLRGLSARLNLTPDDIKLVEVPGSFTDVP